MRIKKETISILSSSLFFLMLLLTKFDVKAILFFCIAVYAVLRPPYTELSILSSSLFFLMLLLTKFDIKAMLFYTAVYTVLRPPYTVLRPPNEQRKKIIITVVITLVIYFIYWR